MRHLLATLALALLLPACAVTDGNEGAAEPSAAALAGEAAELKMTSLKPPAQVSLAYAPAPPHRLTLTVEWGALAAVSAGAPPFERRISGTVRIEDAPSGLHLIVEREATVLARADASRRAEDVGTLRATILPDGRALALEATVAGFETGDGLRYLDRLREDLLYRDRPSPFRRFAVPAGPGDIGGRERARTERAARTAAAVALSPLAALLSERPVGPQVEGDSLVLMRRDFGPLFRSHPDLWTETRGRIAGMTRYRGRRAVVVVVDDALPSRGPAPGWRLETRGRGLLDADTGLYLEITLDHVLTAPGDDPETSKFLVRERLKLE